MKKLIPLVIAVIIILFFVSNKKDEVQVAKIGVIAPLTGIVASYGEDIQKGVLAAEISTPSLIFEDDKCEPASAVSAFNKLINVDKATIIIGPGCGSPQEAIVPLLKDKEAVVIVSSAASQNLYEQSGGKFFNIQYSLESEAAFLADKMLERDLQKVLVISYKNAFSQTVADSFKANFKGEVAREIKFAENSSDITTEIAKLKGLDYDAIIVTDITFFFVQGSEKLKQYGITVPVYASYVAELPAVRLLVEGVFYSYPGGLKGDKGAVYELSKEAGIMANDASAKCGSDAACVKKFLMDSGEFDEVGTSKREIVLKQIVGGEAVEVK